MPFFQGTLGRIETGSSYLNLERVQGLTINTQLSRADTNYLEEITPVARPYNIYPQILCNIDYIKSDKNIEYAIGLVSGASIISNLLDSNSIGFGLRNYEFVISDRISLIPSGGVISLKSGVLTNYTLNASINDNARCSIGIEALDTQIYTNSIPEIQLQLTGAQIVKQEDLSITNISLTGIGLTDMSIQNFTFEVAFNRTPELNMGDYYPIRRNLVGPIVGRVNLNGYIESLNNMTGLLRFKDGLFYSGNLSVILTQSCSQNPISSIYTFQNPYISTFSYSEQVGGYTSFNLDLEIPIGINSQSNQSSIIMT